MKPKYTLVTGATGFIGFHVTQKLLSDGQYPIVAIVRKSAESSKLDELERRGAILVKGSFCDKDLLEKTFQEFPVEHVVHMAAIRGRGVGKREDYYQINVLGTEKLLDISLRHIAGRFLHVSSVGVLGTIPSELPGTVLTKYNPDNLYHESKMLAEEKVNQSIRKGLDACIVRPTITYGQRDNGFPKTLVELVRKKLLFLPSGDVKIHLLDVESLANLLSQVLKSDNIKGRCFIAADRSPISLRELANLIYRRYYGRDYPSCLKIPKTIFNLLLFVFRLSGREKWTTRILLISRSWYYDISHTVKELSFVPSDTREAFVRTMLS